MSPVEIVLAVVVAARLAWEAYANLAGKKVEALPELERIMDERVKKELDRMDRELAALRGRVLQLEMELHRNEIPVPPYPTNT